MAKKNRRHAEFVLEVFGADRIPVFAVAGQLVFAEGADLSELFIIFVAD